MTKEQEDQFDVLRRIKTKPKATQRELAKDLGFSLGKLNYCLKALKAKYLAKSETNNINFENKFFFHKTGN